MVFRFHNHSKLPHLEQIKLDKHVFGNVLQKEFFIYLLKHHLKVHLSSESKTAIVVKPVN